MAQISPPTVVDDILKELFEKVSYIDSYFEHTLNVKNQLRHIINLRKEHLTILHGLPDHDNNYTPRLSPLSEEHTNILESNLEILNSNLKEALEYRGSILLPRLEELADELYVIGARLVQFGVAEGRVEWCDSLEGNWKVCGDFFVELFGRELTETSQSQIR